MTQYDMHSNYDNMQLPRLLSSVNVYLP